MQDISHTIKELSEIEFPPGLHGIIMRRLLFLKFRTPFLVVVGLLLMNLVVSAARLWQAWSDVGGSELVSFVFSNLEFTGQNIKELVVILFDALPIGWMIVFVLNLILVVYVARFPATLKKHREKFSQITA